MRLDEFGYSALHQQKVKNAFGERVAPEDIEHYGVLGQKWGIRNYQNKDGSLKPAGEKRYAEKNDTSRGMRKAANQARLRDASNRKMLSDTDLKKKIERLKMERELRTLTDEEVSPGKAVVKKIMADSGKKVATAVVTGAALYGIKKIMLDKAGKDELSALSKKLGKLKPGTDDYDAMKDSISELKSSLGKIDWKDLAGYATPKPKNK